MPTRSIAMIGRLVAFAPCGSAVRIAAPSPLLRARYDVAAAAGVIPSAEAGTPDDHEARRLVRRLRTDERPPALDDSTHRIPHAFSI